MSSKQPFLYHAPTVVDSRLPTTIFDPKAVTRASYAPRPPRPRHEGPLISFNRHPDAHVVPTTRSNHAAMGPRSKSWIRWMRLVQLCLRVLELNTALAILTLLILLTKMESLTAWVLRIAPVVVAIHAAYAIYHLARPAGGRTPASSAFYHLFAAIFDLGTAPIYGFGVVSVKLHGSAWGTLLPDGRVLEYLVPTVYYTMIGAASLHLVSLSISSWLVWMFRKITLMPPDMNPLEDHLTSRTTRHKKKKSSVTSFGSGDGEFEPLRMPLRAEDLSRPPSIPFADTRPKSTTTAASSSSSLSSSSPSTSANRDSGWDYPGRMYQIAPGNSSRHSAASARASARYSLTSARGGNSPPSSTQSAVYPNQQSPRKAMLAHSSYDMSDSLIPRTAQAQSSRPAVWGESGRTKKYWNHQTYELLSQRQDDSRDAPEERPEEEDVSDQETEPSRDGRRPRDRWATEVRHPDPLGSNPTSPHVSATGRFSPPPLDHHPALRGTSPPVPVSAPVKENRLRVSLVPDEGRWLRSRNSSIQPDAEFYAKPYGELKAATPPVVIGAGGLPNAERQVSSGNDVTKVPSLLARRVASGRKDAVYAYGED